MCGGTISPGTRTGAETCVFIAAPRGPAYVIIVYS